MSEDAETFWTDERVEALRAHFERGLSAQQSAILLKATRHAVLGKRYRLGLILGQAEVKYRASTRNRSTKWAPEGGLPEIATPQELAAGGLGTIATLAPNGCRWPIEPTMVEPGYLTPFCGLPSIPDPMGKGRCYCAEHFARAYPRSPTRSAPAVDLPLQEAA